MLTPLVHASKDQILLDGDYGEDEDEDDEEVFALKGLSDEGEDEEPEQDEDEDMAMEVDEPTKAKKPSKSKSKSKDTSPSSSSGSEEEEEGWGKGKAAYYSSNAAQLESDDEEGNQLEEQEAIRLQRNLRDEMGEVDFGLDDPLDIGDKEDAA